MATTTNYGWTTPDDTALVKDGAAAIRTLGSSIDTSVKSLNAGTTAGDLDYYTSATAKARIGIGTNGQVLTSNGSVPSWQTASSGGMTLISETVASGLTSLSLSSIPSTYKQLKLVWFGITHSNNTSGFDLRLNNDSGANYTFIRFGANGAAPNSSSSNSATSVNNGNYNLFAEGANNGTMEYAAMGTLLIDNYASTSKFKSIYGSFYAPYQNSPYYDVTMFGAWRSTSAVTSLDIVRLAGTSTFSNIANTSIRLYGIS